MLFREEFAIHRESQWKLSTIRLIFSVISLVMSLFLYQCPRTCTSTLLFLTAIRSEWKNVLFFHCKYIWNIVLHIKSCLSHTILVCKVFLPKTVCFHCCIQFKCYSENIISSAFFELFASILDHKQYHLIICDYCYGTYLYLRAENILSDFCLVFTYVVKGLTFFKNWHFTWFA